MSYAFTTEVIELEGRACHIGVDVTEAETLVGGRGIPGDRRFLGHRAGAGSGNISPSPMMGDIAGHLVVLPEDVTVRIQVTWGNGAGRRSQRRCRGSPNPTRIEIEQRPMGEHDDRRLRSAVSDRTSARRSGHRPPWPRIGDIVERDEMHAFVIEGVVGSGRRTAGRLRLVEGGIVLARQEAHGLDLQPGGDVAKLIEPVRRSFGSSVVWVRSP